MRFVILCIVSICLYQMPAWAMAHECSGTYIDHKTMQLFNTVKNGYITQTLELLQQGASVNARDNRKFTPLMFAADNGDAQMAELLLKQGADSNAQDNYGHTALMMAAYYGRLSVVATLLQYPRIKTTLKSIEGRTALDFACLDTVHKTIVSLLLQFDQIALARTYFCWKYRPYLKKIDKIEDLRVLAQKDS